MQVLAGAAGGLDWLWHHRPKRHCRDTFELTPEEWAATYDLLQWVRTTIQAQHEPDGFNIGWNCGRAAGQEIYHAHLHVIPRFSDEPLAGKGIRYWLKQAENARPVSQN